jgi:preprotein translocase SecE subunit
VSRPGLATAGVDDAGVPEPLDHASQPDDSPVARFGEAGRRPGDSGEAELAEAQMALGRPELLPEDENESDPPTADAGAVQEFDLEDYVASDEEEDQDEDELDEGEFEQLEDEVDHVADADLVDVAEEYELEPEHRGRGAEAAALPARRHRTPGNRLVNFVRGSWRELQRVQWPDRRQTMQATGVVIGFVIVAGVFLGVADYFAGKIVNFILTGHFK